MTTSFPLIGEVLYMMYDHIISLIGEVLYMMYDHIISLNRGGFVHDV